MARPTTPDSLKKMGFEVLEYRDYHAKLDYNGQRTAMTGESAKHLLAIARGWVAHVDPKKVQRRDDVEGDADLRAKEKVMPTKTGM